MQNNIIQDEVKESVVKVAAAIFNKYGFNKTTVDEIAKAARKGKSTIYYYFKSKEEIFQAVVEREALTLKARLIAEISKTNSPQEQLKNYVVTRLNSINDLSNFYAAVKNDDLNHLSFIASVKTINDNEEITIVKMILYNGIQHNIFEIDDVELAAQAFVTVFRGLELLVVMSSHTFDDIEPRINKILGMIYKGIVRK